MDWIRYIQACRRRWVSRSQLVIARNEAIKVSRSIALLAGLLCWCTALQGQNYILEYHIDLNLKAGDDFRFYWDNIYYYTAGKSGTIGVGLYRAQNNQTVKNRISIPANYTVSIPQQVEVPCPLNNPGNGSLINENAEFANHQVYSVATIEPGRDGGRSVCYETIYNHETRYSGPIQKITFTGLSRQTWNNIAFGAGFWDSSCGSGDADIYQSNGVQHTFDLTNALNNTTNQTTYFRCLKFSSNTIKVHYFRMYPGVSIYTGGITTIDYAKQTGFSATSGFAKEVYKWQYGIGANRENIAWKNFPAQYQGKSSFSANAAEIMGYDDFCEAYYNKGQHVYVRIAFEPFYTDILTLNLSLPELRPGTIAATSPTKVSNPTRPEVIESVNAAVGNAGTLEYQWEVSYASGTTYTDFTAISGATAAAYQPDDLTAITRFRRKACDSFRCVYTPDIEFTVYDPLLPGTIRLEEPAKAEILSGTYLTLLNETAASGGNGEYNYTWQLSADNEASWDNAPGIYDDGEVYQTGYLQQSTCFRRVVDSKEVDTPVTQMSNTLCVTVYDTVKITHLPANNQYVWQHSSLSPLQAEFSGGNGAYDYVWERSADKEQWETVNSGQSAASSVQYTPPADALGHYYYRCRVSSFGTADTTNTVGIMVYPYTEGGIVAENQEIVEHTAPAILSQIVEPDCAYITYRWEYSVDNDHWQVIEGETEAGYQPAALDTTTYYRRGAVCGDTTIYSNTVTITVYETLRAKKGLNDNPEWYNIPLQIILAGTAPADVRAEASGGNNQYTYRWRQSHDKITWEPAAGDNTAAVYRPPVLQDTTYYYCEIQSFGMKSHSDTAIVYVYTAFTAGSIGGEQKILPGAQPALLTGEAPATGGFCNTRRYQWQDSTVYGRWQNINYAVEAAYRPGTLTETRWYRRRVDLVCEGEHLGTLYSNIVRVGMAGRIAGDQVVGSNASVRELYGVDPITGSGFTYRWQDSVAGRDWQNIAGATGAAYTACTIHS